MAVAEPRVTHPPPPAFATASEYGARLGDSGFWEPYLRPRPRDKLVARAFALLGRWEPRR